MDLKDGTLRHYACSSLSSSNLPDDDTVYGCNWHDVLFVDGGNTFYLWDAVVNSRIGLEGFQKLACSNGCTYVGVSAGAITAGERVGTALIKGWDDPDVVEGHWDWGCEGGAGIGGDGRSFFPHYKEEWEGKVKEWEECGGGDTVRIRECECWVDGVGIVG